MYDYLVKIFGDNNVSIDFYNDVKTAYKKANGFYRQFKSCVVLENIKTNTVLYSRCDNDYAVDQWFKYMNDENNFFNGITAYKTI